MLKISILPSTSRKQHSMHRKWEATPHLYTDIMYMQKKITYCNTNMLMVSPVGNHYWLVAQGHWHMNLLASPRHTYIQYVRTCTSHAAQIANTDPVTTRNLVRPHISSYDACFSECLKRPLLCFPVSSCVHITPNNTQALVSDTTKIPASLYNIFGEARSACKSVPCYMIAFWLIEVPSLTTSSWLILNINSPYS